jgi:hypothetical protein
MVHFAAAQMRNCSGQGIVVLFVVGKQLRCFVKTRFDEVVDSSESSAVTTYLNSSSLATGLVPLLSEDKPGIPFMTAYDRHLLKPLVVDVQQMSSTDRRAFQKTTDGRLVALADAVSFVVADDVELFIG